MRLAVVGLGALVLAACTVFPGHIHTVFPANIEPGAYPFRELPVEVFDMTGDVTGVAVLELDGSTIGGDGRGALEGDSIVLQWIGGACEDRVAVIVRSEADRYDVRIHPELSLLGMLGCPAVGIARALRLDLRTPHLDNVVATFDSY
jgi:hypothetical protein